MNIYERSSFFDGLVFSYDYEKRSVLVGTYNLEPLDSLIGIKNIILDLYRSDIVYVTIASETLK